MTLNGFDVSNHQNGLDVGMLPGDFVICKATEGLTFNDGNFDQFMARASYAGKLVGAYHFMTTQGDAETQADHFIAYTANWVGKALLALDVETNVTAAEVQAFLERVHKKTSVWPLVYLSTSWLNSGYVNEAMRKKCGIWLADWGGNQQTSVFPTAFRDSIKVPSGSNIAIWQFVSKFQTGIWGSGLDADVAFMDRAAWQSYATGKGAATTPTVEKKTVSQLAAEVIAGKWGNGAARKQALEAAGYDYSAVQAEVNRRLKK